MGGSADVDAPWLTLPSISMVRSQVCDGEADAGGEGGLWPGLEGDDGWTSMVESVRGGRITKGCSLRQMSTSCYKHQHMPCHTRETWNRSSCASYLTHWGVNETQSDSWLCLYSFRYTGCVQSVGINHIIRKTDADIKIGSSTWWARYTVKPTTVGLWGPQKDITL